MRRLLNYPGSKWRLSSKIVELMPEHRTYLEPFFGSGAILFAKEPSAIETVNDLDDNIVNLFSCIRKDPDRLIKDIVLTPYSRQAYEEALGKMYDFLNKDDDTSDSFERAKCFLICCSMGYGFRASNRKCGWKSDISGRESAYALRNWVKLPKAVEQVAIRLKSVQIEHQDAFELMKRYDNPKVLMYLDPPYCLDTRNGTNYRYEFSEENHVRLLEFCATSKANIILSGYENDLYREYLHDWNKYEFPDVSQAGTKRVECIWCNY